MANQYIVISARYHTTLALVYKPNLISCLCVSNNLFFRNNNKNTLYVMIHLHCLDTPWFGANTCLLMNPRGEALRSFLYGYKNGTINTSNLQFKYTINDDNARFVSYTGGSNIFFLDTRYVHVYECYALQKRKTKTVCSDS